MSVHVQKNFHDGGSVRYLLSFRSDFKSVLLHHSIQMKLELMIEQTKAGNDEVWRLADKICILNQTEFQPFRLSSAIKTLTVTHRCETNEDTT
jgi:hypothetical protein